MALEGEIITIYPNQRWKVRSAISWDAAEDAIAEARVTGSVGMRSLRVVNGKEVVEADVVQINSDGTERKPYTEAY